MGDTPEPVESDSRGILDPWLLRKRVTLTRYPPGDALDGVVDRFWAVRWNLPDGVVHRQQVVTHPSANLSVGNANVHEADGTPPTVEARCNGVARGVSTRVLRGRGWTVAAMTTPGGLGAFTTVPVAEFTDRVVPLGDAIGVDDARLVAEVDAAGEEPERVAVLAAQLVEALVPEQVPGARQVADVARLAETDRSVRRLADLSAASGIAPRRLQRMFQQYAGVSPTWVVRRYRLLDAAEAVRSGEQVSWADLAGELGYADQAHLTRDFRATIGQTPAAYAAGQNALRAQTQQP
ncbi:MAG TPA: AraC family transcriptional regulator [Pseudonocardiaceae bacterium]|nr:AraC family transcriptional regulator [Pseudonocardiaceae bacterium]